MKTWQLCAVLTIMALAVLGCARLDRLVARLAGQAEAAAAGDPARGAAICRGGVEGAPPCVGCHLVRVGGAGFSLGPNLAGVGSRAAERVEGMSAAQYLEESILHPGSHVVAGYHVSMFADYADYLSPQDVADLIAYLLAL